LRVSAAYKRIRKYHSKNRPVQPLSPRIWTPLNRHWVTSLRQNSCPSRRSFRLPDGSRDLLVRGKNDVLGSLFLPSGEHSSGRSSPVISYNSKRQASSMPLGTYRYDPSRRAAIRLRLVLLYATIASYGTQAILAEPARTRMEGAICCLARWRAAGWKNLPLSGSL